MAPSRDSRTSIEWLESAQVNTSELAAQLMCDVAGYSGEPAPWSKRLLDPAAGTGELLRPVINHLLETVVGQGVDPAALEGSVRAYEMDPVVAAVLRRNVRAWLADGLGPKIAEVLVDAWISEGDFLLANQEEFDFVVVNPPYMRLSRVPDALRKSYLERWATLSGRADVYVAFIEASLATLREDGAAVVLAPDRWMRSGYGARLRKEVAAKYCIEQVLSIADRDAFKGEVQAYPTISVMRRVSPQGNLRVGEVGQVEGGLLRVVGSSVISAEAVRAHQSQARYWPTWSRMPPALPTEWKPLEESGVQVRTGVATGKDAAFVLNSGDERLRHIPDVFRRTAVRARDITSDGISDRLPVLIDPAVEAHEEDRVKLSSYLESLGQDLERREYERKGGGKWWRLIDRVRVEENAVPKILLPDLRGHIVAVRDDAGLTPLHGITYLMSDSWDLDVLGGLLISDLVARQLQAYSPAVSGAAYRVAGHYVKALVVPPLDRLLVEELDSLGGAFRDRDPAAASATIDSIISRLAIAAK